MKRWIITSAAAFVAVVGLALVEPASEAQAKLFRGGDCCGKCHGGHRHHRHHRRCHGRCNGYGACQGYVGCCGQVVSSCNGAVEHGSAYRGEMAPVPEGTAPPPAPEATSPAPPPPPATPAAPPVGSGDAPAASEATSGA
jgi:hypothetical protein